MIKPYSVSIYGEAPSGWFRVIFLRKGITMEIYEGSSLPWKRIREWVQRTDE